MLISSDAVLSNGFAIKSILILDAELALQY